MDNLWLLLLGLLALAVLAFLFLPGYRKTAGAMKKPELPTREPAEEFAQEISPEIPKVSHLKPVPRIEEDPFIPHYYGVSRLVAIARDPNWLYAYWEVNDQKKREFIHLYGEETWLTSRQVLRIYDVTGLEDHGRGGHSYQEISLDPFADNWFIEVGQPERTFFLELGRVLLDGRYILLLTSNQVTTPRASVSERWDEQWMWIEKIYKNEQVPYGFSSAMMAGKGIEPLERSCEI